LTRAAAARGKLDRTKAKRRVTRSMSAESSPKERGPKSSADQGAARTGRRSRIRERLVGIHSRSRRLISEHRHRRKLRDREVSDRSRRGLDWANFFRRRADELRLVPGVLPGRSRLVEAERRACAHRRWIGGGGGTNPRRRTRRRGAMEAGSGSMRLWPDCGLGVDPRTMAELLARVLWPRFSTA
jgi:hypothetical protein